MSIVFLLLKNGQKPHLSIFTIHTHSLYLLSLRPSVHAITIRFRFSPLIQDCNSTVNRGRLFIIIILIDSIACNIARNMDSIMRWATSPAIHMHPNLSQTLPLKIAARPRFVLVVSSRAPARATTSTRYVTQWRMFLGSLHDILKMMDKC